MNKIFLHCFVYPIQLCRNQLRVATSPHIPAFVAITNLEQIRVVAMVVFEHIHVVLMKVARNLTTVRTLMMRVLTKVAAGS